MKKTEPVIEYNLSIRIFECISIVVNILLCLYLFYSLKDYLAGSFLRLLSIGYLAWLFADFASGLVHWLADTWGKVTWPIIGNVFIRSFQEHHIDPQSITRHDFIETNGTTFFVGIPFLIICTFFVDGNVNDFQKYIISIFILTNLWTASTNQIHKWAHQSERPGFVTYLQNKKIILHPIQHEIHHTGSFDHHYCITNGVLNPLLEKIGFFKFLEKAITKVTKLNPRD